MSGVTGWAVTAAAVASTCASLLSAGLLARSAAGLAGGPGGVGVPLFWAVAGAGWMVLSGWFAWQLWPHAARQGVAGGAGRAVAAGSVYWLAAAALFTAFAASTVFAGAVLDWAGFLRAGPGVAVFGAGAVLVVAVGLWLGAVGAAGAARGALSGLGAGGRGSGAAPRRAAAERSGGPVAPARRAC